MLAHFLSPSRKYISKDNPKKTISKKENQQNANKLGLKSDTSVTPDTGDVTDSEKVKSSPRVAVVIDDVGNQTESIPIYSRMNQPLTFAILPGRPHSRRFYEKFKSRYEFIIHFPMEPKGYPENDPGKHALMTSMSKDNLQEQVKKILNRYPKVVGINNHMGSKFTSSPESMSVVMKVLSSREMFFLDSLTSRESVVSKIGKKYGVTVLRNQVFLDNERNTDSIRNQFRRLVELARKEGTAIGIGHFQSLKTANFLEKAMKRYSQKGIKFVPVSNLIQDYDGNWRGTSAQRNQSTNQKF